MFIDSQAQYSVAQDIGQAAGTYVSTNIFDHGAADADFGHGKRTFIDFNLDEAITSAGAATLNVQLQTANDEAFASPVVIWQTGVLAYGAVAAALADPLPFPLGGKRYSRLAYVIAVATTTAGQITASVVLDIQRSHAFPTGIL